MKAIQSAPQNEFGDRSRQKRLQAVSEDSPCRVALFRRVYSGEASPRECIKAFCLECCWFDEAAIRECTATACPLWNLRPFVQREGQEPRT